MYGTMSSTDTTTMEIMDIMRSTVIMSNLGTTDISHTITIAIITEIITPTITTRTTAITQITTTQIKLNTTITWITILMLITSTIGKIPIIRQRTANK